MSPTHCSETCPEPTEVTCPHCDGRAFYTLADGRLQCKDCRKKLSLKPQRTHLSEEVLRGIVTQFWGMVPAEQGAALLNLDRKTMQRYYTRLRQAIAAENFNFLDALPLPSAHPGPLPDGLTLLGILVVEQRVQILFPEPSHSGSAGFNPAGPPPICVVRSYDAEALRQLDLERCRVAAWPPDQELNLQQRDQVTGLRFWSFASQRLKRYRGGYKRNFPLFMAEMVFRFNHPQPTAGLKRLLTLVQRLA